MRWHLPLIFIVVNYHQSQQDFLHENGNNTKVCLLPKVKFVEGDGVQKFNGINSPEECLEKCEEHKPCKFIQYDHNKTLCTLMSVVHSYFSPESYRLVMLNGKNILS